MMMKFSVVALSSAVLSTPEDGLALRLKMQFADNKNIFEQRPVHVYGSDDEDEEGVTEEFDLDGAFEAAEQDEKNRTPDDVFTAVFRKASAQKNGANNVELVLKAMVESDWFAADATKLEWFERQLKDTTGSTYRAGRVGRRHEMTVRKLTARGILNALATDAELFNVIFEEPQSRLAALKSIHPVTVPAHSSFRPKEATVSDLHKSIAQIIMQEEKSSTCTSGEAAAAAALRKVNPRHVLRQGKGAGRRGQLTRGASAKALGCDHEGCVLPTRTRSLSNGRAAA